MWNTLMCSLSLSLSLSEFDSPWSPSTFILWRRAVTSPFVFHGRKKHLQVWNIMRVSNMTIYIWVIYFSLINQSVHLSHGRPTHLCKRDDNKYRDRDFHIVGICLISITQHHNDWLNPSESVSEAKMGKTERKSTQMNEHALLQRKQVNNWLKTELVTSERLGRDRNSWEIHASLPKRHRNVDEVRSIWFKALFEH